MSLKVGIVSDLHCNLQGLDLALEAMGGVDELLCLGDSINEARFSNETIAALKARGAQVILGNHEEAFLSPAGERAREVSGTDPAMVAWLVCVCGVAAPGATTGATTGGVAFDVAFDATTGCGGFEPGIINCAPICRIYGGFSLLAVANSANGTS